MKHAFVSPKAAASDDTIVDGPKWNAEHVPEDGDYSVDQITGAQASLGFTPENVANKDAASGYPGLDSSGLLKAAEFPQNILIPLDGGAAPLLRSLKLASVLNETLASGDNSLYVVPSGKRAFISATLFNPTLGAITFTEKFSVSSVGYTVGASAPATSISANSSVALVGLNTWPIAEAGDSIVLNCSALGLTLFGGIFTFDNTESLKSPRLLSLSSGNNTVYTCPSGKVAFLINLSAAGNAPIRMVNVSGGSRTIVWYVVPNSGSPSSANQLTPSTSVTNNTVNNLTSALVCFNAGDSLVISSDSNASGQVAYALNLIEIPA